MIVGAARDGVIERVSQAAHGFARGDLVQYLDAVDAVCIAKVIDFPSDSDEAGDDAYKFRIDGDGALVWISHIEKQWAGSAYYGKKWTGSAYAGAGTASKWVPWVQWPATTRTTSAPSRASKFGEVIGASDDHFLVHWRGGRVARDVMPRRTQAWLVNWASPEVTDQRTGPFLDIADTDDAAYDETSDNAEDVGWPAFTMQGLLLDGALRWTHDADQPQGHVGARARTNTVQGLVPLTMIGQPPASALCFAGAIAFAVDGDDIKVYWSPDGSSVLTQNIGSTSAYDPDDPPLAWMTYVGSHFWTDATTRGETPDIAWSCRKPVWTPGGGGWQTQYLTLQAELLAKVPVP